MQRVVHWEELRVELGLNQSERWDEDDRWTVAISKEQAAAAASPRRPIRQLAAADRASKRGTFQDVEALVAQVGASLVMELGKPLPKARYLPKRRVGSNPAAHNRALLAERRR